MTGSCYLIETENRRLLLECGIRQGRDRPDDELSATFDFEPRKLDAAGKI